MVVKHSLRHLILEGKADAPNYKEATSHDKSCSTCGAYKTWGWCEMFDFIAKADFTCSDWMSHEEWAKED